MLFTCTISKSYLLEGDQRFPVLIVNGAVVDEVEILWPIPFHPVTGDSFAWMSYSGADMIQLIGYVMEQFLFFLAKLPAHRIPWSMLWRTLICDQSVSGLDLRRASKADKELVAPAISLLISKWQERRRTFTSDLHHSNAGSEYGRPIKVFQRAVAIRGQSRLTRRVNDGVAKLQHALHSGFEHVGHWLRRGYLAGYKRSEST